MNTLADRKEAIALQAQAMDKKVYDDAAREKDPTQRIDLQQKSPKLATLEDAIRRSGLKDGMTISFHHHFRGGDKVVNMVVDKLAEMGYKDLHLENAKSICGSLGYALPDAQYADKVVVITDDLVPYPNTPNAISERDVDYVVTVDSVGDSSKISSGAIRDTKNPRDILLAQQAAKVIINSGYFKNGFSIQTGSGGASLAAVKFIREQMIEQGIVADFALGGITAHMVKLHEEGLIKRLIDVQSFDKVAAESLKNDPMHKEVSANEYASADEPGSATHYLDIVILSALEADVNFNVNVLVGSDGIIRGAIGGHPDTAADSALSIIVCPLLRGRIPCIVDEVTTLITPGSSVDVIVTEYGIAVNPRRPELKERLEKAGLNIVDIHSLRDRALKVIGTPEPIPFGDKTVGVVMNRDGSVQDVIMNVKD